MPRSGTPSRRVFIGAALAALAAAPTALHAQSGGVVRFALPNATASGVDAITRAAAGALGRALDASVVVENQPGAGGRIEAAVRFVPPPRTGSQFHHPRSKETS